MNDDTIYCISFPRMNLDNGFFANQNGGYWYIYHESNPTQCVWVAVDSSDARNFARLPDLQKVATEHHVRSAIEDDTLVLYIECSWASAFGQQSGISVVRVKTLRELKVHLGY